MKLKKIASLMLAGIMAVSMLTACGDSTTDNSGDNSSSSQPTVSNASNVMWNGMNKDARDIVDPVANATLENSLRKNVEIYGNLDNVVEYVLSHIIVVVLVVRIILLRLLLMFLTLLSGIRLHRIWALRVSVLVLASAWKRIMARMPLLSACMQPTSV